MAKANSVSPGYGVVSRVLHWLIAVLIIGLIWLGWYMVDLTYYDRWQNFSLTAHRALGMLVAALALVKMAWLRVCASPPFVDTIEPWERVAATATHHTLYLAMILIPVTGYAISTSSGDAVPFFGWFTVPVVVAVSDRLRDWAIEIHFYVAYAVALVVILHALAALKHQFIDKDGTLRRMLW